MRARNPTTPPVSLGLALLLGMATTACVGQIGAPGAARPGAAQVEVRLDPARGLPASCTEVWVSYAARRTGDVAGAPPVVDSFGDTSAEDAQSQPCSSADTFTIPDRFDLMQGRWEFKVKVTTEARDGALQFEGTCSGVPVRSRTVHVLNVTQPRTGTDATCTFSL